MSRQFKKATAWVAIIALGSVLLLLTGIFTSGRSALAAGGRTLVLTWETTTADPAITHHGGGFLHAVTTSGNAIDKKIALTLVDAGGISLLEFALDGDPLSPLGGGTAELVDGLPGYPAGAVFLIRAQFYDASGVQIDTLTANFTKP